MGMYTFAGKPFVTSMQFFSKSGFGTQLTKSSIFNL